MLTSRDWVCEVTVGSGERLGNELLERLMDDAEGREWSVGRWHLGDGVAVVARFPGSDDPVGAARAVCGEVLGWLGGFGVVGELEGLELVREVWREVEAFRPTVPELVGVAGVAEMLGVSRRAVRRWCSGRAGFPAPLMDLGADGPVWKVERIRQFMAEH